MARAKKEFLVRVLRESGLIYAGPCNALTVPSLKDQVTILPQHTPIIMKMGPGQIIIRRGRETQVLTEVKQGLLYVGDNEASVLVDL